MKKRLLAILLVVMTLTVTLGMAGSASADSWQKDSRGWWYSFSRGGYARSQWLNLNGTWYAFDSNGYMLTGWYWIDGSDYYFTSSGAMVTGWKYISGEWYYFSNTGARQSGWFRQGNTWYYLDPSENGAMVTGWKTIGGTKYYFSSGGAMQTGWCKISGNWYYFATSGAMSLGWQQIGGKYYYFYPSGIMAYNTTVDGYVLDSSGAWVSTNRNRILTADTTQLTFYNRSSQTVNVTFTESGTIYYYIGDSDIVSCSWSSYWNGDVTRLYVYPLKAGSTTITITNNVNNEIITIPVIVY